MYENRTSECIKSTVGNLCNERPIKSERVAVLVCPPLTEKRFKKEKKGPGFVSKWFVRKREFVREVLKFFSWETYQKEIVLYTFKFLLEIEDHFLATVIPDAKFRHFKKVLDSQYFDVIFIFAHHIVPKGKNTWDNSGSKLIGEIEFADGGTPLEKIQKFLSHLVIEDRISLIFMICESDGLQEVSYHLPAINSVATAFWRINFLYGIEFIKYWIRFLNGENTLSQAYSLAIDAFELLNSTEEEGQ